MSKTKIEWAGHSWNPITGCSKISTGCRNCYAERMARRLAGRYGYPKAPHHFDVTLHPDRLDQPLHWKKPRTVFVCSMSDLWHDDVAEQFIWRVLKVTRDAPQHIYQILTKRPGRMAPVMRECYARLRAAYGSKAEEPQRNLWLGITAENQATADKRIPILLQTPAAVRFVSCEPLLGPIDLHVKRKVGGVVYDYIGLDWVIVGGESGPGARPMNPQWARDIRDRCQATGVPFFFKQWGAWRRVGKKKAGHLLDGQEWREFPT